MCISTNSSVGSGICTSFFTNGSKTLSIPAGDTTPYRWGAMLINVGNPGELHPTTLNGFINVTGRVVQISSINDSPDPILINQSSTITYSGADAITCSIAGTHPNGAPFSAVIPCNSGSYLYVNNGSSGTANYTVTFRGPDQFGNMVNITRSDTITVNSLGPNVDLRCNGTNGPCSINSGDSVTLSWTSNNATSCTTTGPGFSQGGLSNPGISTGPIVASTTYTTSCTGPGGNSSDSVNIVVTILTPTVDLKCNGINGPCSVPSGSSATLSWTTTGATTCTASGEWSGSKGISGSESSPPITGLFHKKFALHIPVSVQTLWNRLNEKVVALFDSRTAIAAGNDASVFVSQSVPPVMTAGQTYPVSVTMRNTGPNTWTNAANYRLGSQNPQDTLIWGCAPCGRIFLAPGDAIATNQQKTFSFTVTAPAVPGNYNMQWRMLQEGVNWFGAFSTNAVVVVQSSANNANFVSQNVPSNMSAGQTYPVTLTMQNAGSTTWTAALNYRLGAINPYGTTTWTTTRAYLAPGDSIAPGQQKTFSFNVIAPATPGTYNFQWQMLRELVEWFGVYAPNIPVTVLPVGSHNFTLTCTGPGGSAVDSVIVQAAPNQPPVTSNVRVTEPDYCASSPGALAQWTYTDPDGSPQSAYQVQVDTDPAFGSPDRDTGKLTGAPTSYTVTPALNYNTVYRARVRTWDASDAPSPWTIMSLCTGTGCQPGNTAWQTPLHAYPAPVNFTWTPSTPQVSMNISFVHDPALTCFGGCSYNWTFGDSGVSTDEVPVHAYTASGSYQATLSVADSSGYTCPSTGPLTKTLTIGNQSVPQFKEVLP